MTLSRTQVLLLVAGLVTLALTWQTYQEDVSGGTVLPTRVLATSAHHVPETSVSAQEALVLTERPLVPLTDNLFAKQYVKPQLKPRAVFKRTARRQVAKPVITAPLPFKYIGRWQDQDKQAIMLDYRGEMLVAKQGDILAGRYKLEEVNETQGRIQLNFLEVTSNKRQTMQVRVGQP